MYATGESLPVAEHLGDNGINLPSSTKLSEEDIGRVCSVISSK
jgi:dTDP-4-amino-4,6-dideoxygalactose transaminase